MVVNVLEREGFRLMRSNGHKGADTPLVFPQGAVEVREREPEYDVIVVGGGPGGAVAATILAQKGRSILLVDQAFSEDKSRDKACGDAVPWRARRFMEEPLGIDIARSGLIYEPISAFAIGIDTKEIVVRRREWVVPPIRYRNKPVAFTSPRENFDNVLFQNSLVKGAHFEQMHVVSPLYDDQGKVVGVKSKDGRELTARLVIAAGGATCPIATALRGRVANQNERAVAIRAYAHLPKEQLDDRLVLRFLRDLMPGGYAWIFRLPNKTINLGLGLFDFKRYRGVNLRKLMDEFIQELQSEFPGMEVQDDTIKSWQIPFYVVPNEGEVDSRVVNGVCLVGDAGRNTDALTGGGIYPAMQSGYLAALYALYVLEGMDQTEAQRRFDEAYQKRIGGKLAKAYRVQQEIVHSLLLGHNAIASRVPDRLQNRYQLLKERVEEDFLIFYGLFHLAYYFPPLRFPVLRALTGEHTDEAVEV